MSACGNQGFPKNTFWNGATNTTPMCQINPESGGRVREDTSYGLMGPCELYRAQQESELARFNPDVISQAVSRTYEAPFMSLITPDKPAPVTLAGADVFGPPSYNTSTRNMTLDLRGEAATGPLYGEPPAGASINSRMGSVMQFDNRYNGCSYVPPPYPGGAKAQAGGAANTCPLSGRDPSKCGAGIPQKDTASFWLRTWDNVARFFSKKPKY